MLEEKSFCFPVDLSLLYIDYLGAIYHQTYQVEPH